MSATRAVVMFTPGIREPGGASKHSLLLARGLAGRGWRVTVISRESREWVPRVLRDDAGPRLISLPGFAGSRAGAVLFVLLAPLVGVIMGRHGSRYLGLQLAGAAVACSLAATFAGARPALLAFSSGAQGEAEFIAASRWRRQRVALLRRAGVLVGQTPFAAEELARLVPGARTAVLPTPVLEPETNPGLNGLPRAAFSGRLTEGKGLIDLLEAWERVVDEQPESRLSILGSGGRPGGTRRPIDKEINALVEARPILKRSVILEGWVDDVAAQLVSSDVYVFPSESEGMSNALLEACALRRVVVASDIPANRAVLGDQYPLLFPAGDRVALASTLFRAFDDARIRTAARGAIDERMERFLAPSVVADLETTLLELG